MLRIFFIPCDKNVDLIHIVKQIRHKRAIRELEAQYDEREKEMIAYMLE